MFNAYRIFKFTDPYKGWGDSGTVKFVTANNRQEVFAELKEQDPDFVVDYGVEEINDEHLELRKVDLLNRIENYSTLIREIEQIQLERKENPRVG